MEQTAVEWLVEQLDGENHLTENEIKRLIQQAKEMEKEQIIKSIIDTIVGSNKIYDKEYPEVRYTAEQYYNETFKSE